jgi:rRNA metabolism SBDS family protein
MVKQVIARLKREGKTFEILVDIDEALKVKEGKGSINLALILNSIFYNIKSGEIASSSNLFKIFGTSDILQIGEKIIKSGEIEIPSEYIKKEREQKYKQAIDFLSKNAVDASGRPYTPDRILRALEESKVNIQNKPIDSQIQDIMIQLQKIIPIKLEIKKIRVTIPAQHTGRAYGTISSYKEKEDWLSNGDLQATLSIPAGLLMDFYDKLNSVTHGSAFAEEIKEGKK